MKTVKFPPKLSKLVFSKNALGIFGILLIHQTAFCQFFDDDDFGETYDDSSYYIDGDDVVWIYGPDTGYVYEGEDTAGYNFATDPIEPKAMFAAPAPKTDLSAAIAIKPGSSPKNVVKTQYGFNLAEMFEKGKLPQEATSMTQWGWLHDLKPQSVRIPSGSYSKFTHMLPYRDIEAPFGELDSIKGMGYDIYEIARYFDRTDGTMDYPTNTEILSEVDTDLWWMSNEFKENYKEFLDKYNDQQTATSSYLEDYIDLIQFIETNNGGYHVKVIVCLNILSETATQCRTIINYLMQYVTVAGVEMGNECYDGFHCSSLGFATFDDYYNYINGTTVAGFANVFTHADGSIEPIATDHNYIGAFRGANYLNVKIGVVGIGHDVTSPYPLKKDEEDISCAGETWNSSIHGHYADAITGYPSQKMFDAVILHGYYTPDEYEDDLLGITASLICSDDDPSPYYDPWWFDSFDPRLLDAFVGVRTHIKNFIKTGYVSSYDDFNTSFFFNTAVVSGGKELWNTEWNLKTKKKSYKDHEDQQNKVLTLANDFLNGVLIQEWWLQDLKLNFRTGYRPGFFTYAEYHNFAGGVQENMLTPANDDELVYLGVDYPPYNLNENTDPLARNYYVKRTTMYVAEMFSLITKNSLQYLPATFNMLAVNPNVQPTVFIDNTRSNLYVYFSNVSGIEQDFTVDPTLLIGFFPGATSVIFDPADINCIIAKKPYSTSGSSTLYRFHDNPAQPGDGRINVCYEAEDPDPLIEINQIHNPPNTVDCAGTYFPNGCITVPPYSVGYFVLPMHAGYAPKQATGSGVEPILFSIYPNPASDFFTIFNKADVGDDNTYSANMYDVNGNIVKSIIFNTGDKVEIESLPPGAYSVSLTLDGNKVYSGNLIKQ